LRGNRQKQQLQKHNDNDDDAATIQRRRERQCAPHITMLISRRVGVGMLGGYTGSRQGGGG